MMKLVLLMIPLLVASEAEYCEPWNACWPGAAEWLRLDGELDGMLHKIADVKTVYDQCAAAITEYGGATVSRAANGTCIFSAACVYKDCAISNETVPNIPVYSVEARTVKHVQATVNFARQHSIRVSIKATGASYSISDQQPNSILIWMANYERHTSRGVVESFVDSCGEDRGPAIKVGGGETFGNLFGALAADGRFVASSGAAVTVGAAGQCCCGGRCRVSVRSAQQNDLAR